PGDLFFARPQDTHALDARDGATLVNIAFSKAHFERFLQYAADLPLPFERLHDALPLTVSVDPAQTLDAYERFNARRDAAGAPVQLALRELLCELFGMLLCEPTAAAACPEWLDALCRKMRQYENFTAPADTMVRLSGYSREHLSRSMKRYLGVTPSEFLCGLRLDHAAGLLRLTSMPVLDVCMASGFENPAYFHRRFREKFGMTPGRFRAAINEKSQ
ncbi:MAG: helix-turn-helix transcriptional regulator, partial [Clostridia bacterium]|nr:helix-turn-helix transcriptional regulator [Clostridia bacterium]